MRHRLANLLERLAQRLDHSHCAYTGMDWCGMCCIEDPKPFDQCVVCTPSVAYRMDDPAYRLATFDTGPNTGETFNA